jgi:hypothetical protein
VLGLKYFETSVGTFVNDQGLALRARRKALDAGNQPVNGVFVVECASKFDPRCRRQKSWQLPARRPIRAG